MRRLMLQSPELIHVPLSDKYDRTRPTEHGKSEPVAQLALSRTLPGKRSGRSPVRVPP